MKDITLEDVKSILRDKVRQTLKHIHLQGHSSKDTGANTYMKGIKPEVLLKECVQKFDWGIDWKKLKVDWTKSIQ